MAGRHDHQLHPGVASAGPASTGRPVLLGLALLVTVMIAGCQAGLVTAPNIYVHDEGEPFANVPPAFQTNTVDLLYVTDRLPESGDASEITYGYHRSSLIRWGSAVVELGRDVSWDELVEASCTSKPSRKLPVALRTTTVAGEFPQTPAPLIKRNGVLERAPEYLAAQDEAIAAFQDEVRRRLSMTPRKEAVVFVHGFNNTFEQAAIRLAELWHFLGREGVPVLYSWPAGHPPLLQGYTHDRESGEFTNFHLKQCFRVLAGVQELERINVVAHSRGTDVAATAIKELILVARARGDDPQAVLKIGDIVLAAPDMSAEVVSQRLIAEELHDGLESATYYVNKNDHAIGSAEWLFADKRRIGQMRPEQLGERQRERFEVMDQVNIIDSRVKTSFLGHGYFLDNPATLSDLILLLRYRRQPVASDGRPLTEVVPNYYVLDDNYPQQAAPKPRTKPNAPATGHARPDWP